MRITIETTESEPAYSFKVTKEVPHDDSTVYDMQELIDDVLRACGYTVIEDME